MKSAYLYVRVSTDEQRRKGYSLPEQEDRLLKYCTFNDIEVKGIFREDFSAKSFNRPEWKLLIAEIRRSSSKEENAILFVKWDRFSRNIELAYEMIGILRRYHTTPMAIDQPIDFSVPESSVMLAVYLAIPEAENNRRALNTAINIRKAKQLGRYPNKAPIGYINLSALDGRKYIAPKQPEAGIIKWSFQQLAKNCYTIEEVRRMASAKGLKCSRSYFWKLLCNPVYCGYIMLVSEAEQVELINGVHEPLISVPLFDEVRSIITTKKSVIGKRNELKETFMLTRYLSCPVCSKKLRGSFSRGSTKRYAYYHCSGSCKVRFRADRVNESYNEQLQQLTLSNGSVELFKLVLADANVNTLRIKYLQEQTLLQRQLKEQDAMISKARQLFVADKLMFDDFSELKREYREISGTLKKEFSTVVTRLKNIERQAQLNNSSLVRIFRDFEEMDISDKRQIIHLIPPVGIDFQTGKVSLHLNDALSKIICHQQ